MSWLPLGITGRVPATVKASAEAAEGAVTAEGDTVAGGAAVHPDSAATTHRDAAQIAGSFAGI